MTMSEVWKYYDCYNWIFEGHIVLEPVEKKKPKRGKGTEHYTRSSLRRGVKDGD